MRGGRSLTRWFVVVVLASLNAFAAGPASMDLPAAGRADRTGSAPLGIVLADASVHLNNQPVATGMTVYKGDVIQTGSTSGAIVSFRNGDTATLAKSSEVAMEWESNPTSLNLRQGVLVVQGSARQPASVHVLGATVIVRGEGAEGEFPAICRIAVRQPADAVIFNVRGRVEVHGAGAPFLLPSGKDAHLQARLPIGSGAAPQAAGQLAGHVSREIPEETVQRAGQTAQASLKSQDEVNWEDVVRTLRNGRVQITLLDGSTLNVGARSELKVTKHDVASGETTIEMAVGKMRADVVKVTKPGGSFQVKTQTAVIGVVGTSFIVIATQNNTRAFCLEGLLRISSINGAVAGTATLHAGEFTNVPRGGPPGGVSSSPGGELNSNISQTTIGEAAHGLAAGATGLGTVGGALNATTAGLSAIVVVTSAVAIGRSDSASNTLSVVFDTLGQASAANSSATSNANSATAASNATNTATNTILQNLLSPSAPCGCE